MDREKDGERVSSRLKMDPYSRNSDASLVYPVRTTIMLLILIGVFQIYSKAVMTEVGYNPGMSLFSPCIFDTVDLLFTATKGYELLKGPAAALCQFMDIN